MTFPYALTGGLCARLAGPIRGLGPDHLLRQVAADLRGSLARPWAWLGGLALNLALSLAYLVVAPLTGQSDRDWAVLVGSYFASFILADVTTTNVLGADAGRVRHHLASGTGLGRVLMVKNGALLLVVGVPLLLVTAVLTLRTESASALGLTLGGVLFPILTWLGIGNLVSVALPVRALAWRTRWAQRHDLPATLRWVVALALPYGLCFGLDPLSDLPSYLLGRLGLAGAVAPVTVLVALSGLAYGLSTAVALLWARRWDPLAATR